MVWDLGPVWEYITYKIYEISSVTDYEYIAYIANWHKGEQGDLIDPRLLQRGFTEEQLQQLIDKAQADSMGREITSLNLKIRGNLRRFQLDEFDYVITLYHIYNNTGQLPYPGSISEQPAKIIEIFNILEQLDLERRQRDQAEYQRSMKRNVRR